MPLTRHRALWIVTLLLTAFVLEELRFGLFLGLDPLWPTCQAIGGKPATGHYGSRCFTRVCYWWGSCGPWIYPEWQKVQIGDSKSKVIFRMGEPDLVEGDIHYWKCSKASYDICRATIRNGRMTTLDIYDPGPTSRDSFHPAPKLE